MLYAAIFSFAVLLLWLISSIPVILKPRSPIAIYIVLTMNGFLFWATIYFTWYYTGSERYTVRLRDGGLQFGADETTPYFLLTNIRKLRTRRYSRHIRVIGRDGKPRGVIKLQLEGIADLLRILMSTLENADPQTDILPLRTGNRLRFRRSPWLFIFFQAIVAGFIVLAVKLDPDRWYAPAIFLSPIWLLSVYGFFTGIRRLEFTDNLLVVKTILSRRKLTGSDITSVELSVPAPWKSNESLDVLLRLPGGEILSICPLCQDPFVVFWNCRYYLNQDDDIQVFQQLE